MDILYDILVFIIGLVIYGGGLIGIIGIFIILFRVIIGLGRGESMNPLKGWWRE